MNKNEQSIIVTTQYVFYIKITSLLLGLLLPVLIFIRTQTTLSMFYTLLVTNGVFLILELLNIRQQIKDQLREDD